MNRKSLIIVCGTLESGGAERVISILSTPFADTFNSVSIVTWREAPVFYNIDARIKLISLPQVAKSDNGLKKCVAFRKLILKTRPNLILSFLTLFNLFTLTSLLGTSVPVIVAERNDPRFIKGGFLLAKIRDILYRKAKGILCQTQSIADYFSGSLKNKCHIIYNPVSMAAAEIGMALDAPKKKRIVSVGRLHPQKNHKLLIDAFKIFHNIHPEYMLTIYGKGELEDETRDYIKTQNLEKCVELAGEKQNVKDLIVDAKAFVLTSRYEGMPNALIEAMCLGIPCVSTKVSGAVDLITHKINGLLVDDNPNDVSNAISAIIDDELSSKKMGIAGAKIYSQLNVNAISKSWIEYLESIY